MNAEKLRPLPPLEELQAAFRFEPDTGVLYRKTSCAWREVKSFHPRDGYLIANLSGVMLSGHRVIWKLFHRAEPDGIIDHIDGNPANNKISNLRCVTPSQNMQNRAHPTGKSGVAGVAFVSARSKWRVTIKREGRRIFVGEFFDLDEAIKAREHAVSVYHAGYARAAIRAINGGKP